MAKKNKNGIRNFSDKVKKSLGISVAEDTTTVAENNEGLKEKLLAYCLHQKVNEVKVFRSSDKQRLSGLTFDSKGNAILLAQNSIEIFGYLDRLIRYSAESLNISINGKPLIEIIK